MNTHCEVCGAKLPEGSISQFCDICLMFLAPVMEPRDRKVDADWIEVQHHYSDDLDRALRRRPSGRG